MCVRACHRGHDVVYSRKSRFFCDCGASSKSTGKTCLAQRQSTSHVQQNKTNDSFLQDVRSLEDTLWKSISESNLRLERSSMYSKLIPTFTLSQSKYVRENLKHASDILRSCSCAIRNLMIRLIDNEGEERFKVERNESKKRSRDGEFTTTNDLTIHSDLKVLTPNASSKSGIFRCRSSNLSSQFRLKISVLELNRQALCSNRNGIVAVLEASTVSLFTVAKLITRPQEDTSLPLSTRSNNGLRYNTLIRRGSSPTTSTQSTSKKLEECDFVRLSSTCVDFEPFQVVFHPCVRTALHRPCDENDIVLAVVGLVDCEILVFNSYGSLKSRQNLQLMLNQVGPSLHVRSVLWIPRTMQIAVIANKFVKVYDPTECCIAAKHTFMMTGKDESIMCAALCPLNDSNKDDEAPKIFLGTNSRVLVHHIGMNSVKELTFRTQTSTSTLWHAVTRSRPGLVLPRVASFVSLHFESANFLHFSTNAKVSGTMRLNGNVVESVVSFKDVSNSLGLWNRFSNHTSVSVQLNGDRSRVPSLTAVQIKKSSVHIQTHEIVKCSGDRVVGSCVTSLGGYNDDSRSGILILLDSGEIHSFLRADLNVHKPSIFSFFKSFTSRTSSTLHRVGPPESFEDMSLLTTSDAHRNASNFNLGADLQSKSTFCVCVFVRVYF